MNAGWIGGIAGAIIGLIGGIIGSYFSIKNTSGPRQRAFMVKSCALGWIVIVLFVVLILLLPFPYRYLLWVPYAVLLPCGIIFVNRRLERIKQEESGSHGGQAVR